MPSLASPSSLFSSVGFQATGVQLMRTRLLSTASTRHVEDADDVEIADLRSLSSSVASSTTPSHSTCDTYSQVETEFAEAVLFVESYQGPHRILKQENSSPRKDFYAFYQQATVGPCPTTTASDEWSKLELEKWEKWRKLGFMTRHGAMQRYVTALDNLVDEWRRSAKLQSALARKRSLDTSAVRSVSDAGSAVSNQLKWSVSMPERSPRVYDELGELQDRLDDETKKRDELEAHLLHLMRDNRCIFLNERMEEASKSLVTLVKTLEEDVTQHSTQLQQLTLRQQQLAARAENSVLLAVEARIRHVFVTVRKWVHSRSIRAAFVVLIGLQAWHFLRRRRLPQFIARILIHWLVKVSSLDGDPALSPVTIRH
uniref:ACB domain-containing protein n=1 Tax=Hyaloperonospora arabidopsidis (strain Emoy2) TaxID=559515 RepID=M4BRQ5_HYAAE